MKKVFIDAPLSYVVGHLCYGHLEGVLEMTDEEFERFKKILLISFITMNTILMD